MRSLEDSQTSSGPSLSYRYMPSSLCTPNSPLKLSSADVTTPCRAPRPLHKFKSRLARMRSALARNEPCDQRAAV